MSSTQRRSAMSVWRATVSAQQTELLLFVRRARHGGHRLVLGAPLLENAADLPARRAGPIEQRDHAAVSQPRRSGFVWMDEAEHHVAVAREIFQQRGVRT